MEHTDHQTDQPTQTPETSPTGAGHHPPGKRMWIIGGIAALIIVAGVGAALAMRGGSHAKSVATHKQASSSSTAAGSYDQQAAMMLTHNECRGSGSTTIVPPMKLDQVSTILPYGLMVGGHVTPIDHQYYNGLDPHALRDTYDVVAPMDGTIVDITHRGNKYNTPLHSVDVPSSDEYRIVIAHSCSFLTYVDLVTSLDSSVASKLPQGWNPQNPGNVNIPVKQGQVIGHIGGQTLDFAVWDLSQKPLGFLVRKAYDNAEPWKVFTAPPSAFLDPSIKSQTLAKYVRTAQPVDGKIDYDQEGKLAGSWFEVGTDGYNGGKDQGNQHYWAGHLSFAPNYIDPSMWVVSLGSFSQTGDAQQFGINSNTPEPSKVDVGSGLVKYELVTQEVQNPDGSLWMQTATPGLKAVNSNQVQGVLLVQLKAAHQLEIEVFPGKTAAQVSGFDSHALTYNRGDDAMPPGGSH